MLSDRVVVITGGAGFIGKELVKAVVKNNGTAIIADINEKVGIKVKDDLSATVKFVAEVISVKKKDDKIIEGNPDKIKFVTDVWKFTRNINNKSPNWYLAEIISK